jgi:stage V sporulation protein S
VDRFFSKLDLRDIKIDPYTTSFPPDAEEGEEGDEVGTTASARADEPEAGVEREATQDETYAAVGQSERRPHIPAWAPRPDDASPAPAPAVNGFAGHAAPLATVESEFVETNRVEQNGEVLKVSARSRPSAVAGAIAGVVREVGRAEVQAIGAGATNQAVKAVAIARDYLRETGIEAICLPAFIDITIENEDRTAIRLVVEPR